MQCWCTLNPTDLYTCVVEEDIVVLQGVQHQFATEDPDIARNWQTDWPHNNNTGTATVPGWLQL